MCFPLRLPGSQSVVSAGDGGCVEVYRVQGPVVAELQSSVQAHDDMVLGVELLADSENTVTAGQDGKLVAIVSGKCMSSVTT